MAEKYEGSFYIRPNGADWDLYNNHGQFAQKFTASRWGSTDEAEKEAKRERDNRNRRLDRLRKDDQPPRGRHGK